MTCRTSLFLGLSLLLSPVSAPWNCTAAVNQSLATRLPTPSGCPMVVMTGGSHMRISHFTALAGTLLLADCASKSSEITASYISPITYQSYNCQQLAAEAQALSAKAAELS